MRMPCRFGMFVHFGVYALTGYHEQVRWRFYTPRMEYRKLAERFNPDQFDPDAWVKLAKDAGMEYICFTTKHHDGFCMFNTATTDFNIMNTPYGKDILKELADACHRGGMKLSLYYSNPDWDYEWGYNPKSTHTMPPAEDHKEDIEKLKAYQKAQIKELLTNYGDIYTFFWDIPTGHEDPAMNEYVRSLQPDIIINNRGWNDKGDFSTPERDNDENDRVAPHGREFARMTEACQSVGQQSWGYCADEDYYTLRYLTSAMDQIMVRGGSYLLNVGPMPDGRIPEKAQESIRRVGNWYNRVKPAFDATCCAYLDNTALPTTREGNTLYVHLPDGLNSCGLTLKPINVLPKAVTLLNDGRAIKYDIVTRPEDKNWETQTLNPPTLHLFDLPVEEYYGETMIIQVELAE